MKLQKGNYVLLDGIKEVEIIWQKYDKCCVIELGKEYPSTIVDTERLSGIPITVEMLLKIGYFKCSIRENHFIGEKHNHVIWKCNDMFLCDKNGVNIKHYHRLQNLVFELTDKWLTL